MKEELQAVQELAGLERARLLIEDRIQHVLDGITAGMEHAPTGVNGNDPTAEVVALPDNQLGLVQSHSAVGAATAARWAAVKEAGISTGRAPSRAEYERAVKIIARRKLKTRGAGG